MNFKHQEPNNNNKKNFEEDASFISKLFFNWISSTIKLGNQRELNIDDVPKVREEDQAQSLGAQFELAWNSFNQKQNHNGKNSKLVGLLWSIYGKQYLFYGIFLFICRLVFTIGPIIFLRLLTKSFIINPDDEDTKIERRFNQYLFAGGLCGSTIFYCLIIHGLNFQFFHIGVKCSVGLSSLIYRKLLRLSNFGQTQTSVGQIINLVSSDVKHFTGLIHFGINIIVIPVQTLILVYILWLEIGIACFPGVGFLLIVAPCQYFLGIYSAHFRRRLAKRMDARAHIMNEIINGIRIIKMYVWEKPFSKLIHKLRMDEIKEVRSRAYARATIVCLFNSSNKIAAFLTVLAIYLIKGNDGSYITADKVFFAFSIYNATCDDLLLVFPDAIALVAEIGVALKRIQTFLDLDERKSTRSAVQNEVSCHVQMIHVCAGWSSESLTLRNINLDLEGPKLVIVLGKVGCGKSSVLKVLLEELPILSGSLQANGGLFYYASQEPWIFTGTIRQNITFGQSLHQAHYDAVIRNVGLNIDLRFWPDGDNTVVGEKGITLSGGQKARIGLARCIYSLKIEEEECLSWTRIILLDDPLSAVDSNVSQSIFNELIMKYLQNHMRILVTHQLKYLHSADHIIVLDKGEIIAQGNYNHILSCNIDLMDLVQDNKESKHDKNDEDSYRNQTGHQTLQVKNSNHEQNLPANVSAVNGNTKNDEKSAFGSITWTTYWKYITGGQSLSTVIILCFAFLSLHGIIMFTNVWIAEWTNVVAKTTVTLDQLSTLNTTSEGNTELHQEKYAWPYAILTGFITFMFVFISFIYYRYAMRIGLHLHDRMFSSVVSAPMKFFDTTSSGRIMNRFTKDLSSIDESLPLAMYEVIEVLLKSISVLVIVSWTTPFMILPTGVAMICMYKIRNYYVTASRSLKRIEAISRSPIFTFLSSSYEGLETIRALSAQPRVIQQFDEQLNINTSTMILVAATNRWFSFRIQAICAAYLCLATFGVLLFSSSISSGAVGLAISSAMMLISIQWALRQSAETENLMTCVERIFEFIELQPEEPQPSSQQTALSQLNIKHIWPTVGDIKFQNVSLSYNEDGSNSVLSNLSFHIRGGEKGGVIGRTGAGKSSILSALFRLVEINPNNGGEILIDGLNTRNIGLGQIRSAITIIPQDPVLFSGSLRYNLDPFDQFHDDQLWMVLEQVELKSIISALSFHVADSGANFSVGQKQLICLARALLGGANNKIIVLDEVTANVDLCTDALIQAKLTQHFKDVTIITIAHRIDTVMEADKILVLDHGHLKEFDSPTVLLNNPNSYFSQMIHNSLKNKGN